MRLFVLDKYNNKHYIKIKAESRRELLYKIGKKAFTIGNTVYSIESVTAEASGSDLAGGAIVGGILGLISGGTGALIGGLAGGALGSYNDKLMRYEYRRMDTV